MKKTFILLLLSLISITISAQNVTVQPQLKIGYLSYSAALKAMPSYAEMQNNLESLRKQYSDETKRAEDEFNSKYEEFLDGQRSFAKPILEKRQSELQELLNKNIAFKQEAERLLQQAETDMKAPLKKNLDAILAKIARDRNLTLILNTDNDAVPFIASDYSEDINSLVQNVLKNMH